MGGKRGPEGRGRRGSLGLVLLFGMLAAAPVHSVDAANDHVWSRLDPARSNETVVERLRLLDANRQRMLQTLGPHGISPKGTRARRLRFQRRKTTAAAVPETLRVLLVRIAFESDESGSLTSLTEDGDFLLEPDSSVIFDPPPHDKAYFAAHMAGLSEFWGAMSGGLLRTEFQVLPPGPQDAYRLRDLVDYAPGEGGFWTIEMLEALVRDMILAADAGTQADGSANLADFDYDDPNTYIIFAHAGGDLQSNLVWTPGQEGYSPNDIPTFFVTLGDSAQVPLSSVDSSTGEPGLVRECSVIPESTSQDGLVGSIAAALYHEFGHALGLPDIYSTFTGLPTLGYWELMDTGTNLTAAVGISDGEGGVRAEFVTGLLPPQISIWSKWFLGFVDEVRVGSKGRTLDLPASFRQDRRDHALRLDVSADEFFLVENRWVPPVGDPSWRLISDPATGVIQYLGVVDAQDRIVGNSYMYDFFLPWAGGLQVYRIRQDRIEAGLADNTVQALPGRLGIEMIEADGIQDIGVFDFATRGFFGSDNDAFRDQSTFVLSDTTLTYPRTATEFGPDTFPESRSSLSMPTGVRLSDIGPSDGVTQRVTARVEGFLDLGGGGPGWPLELEPVGGLLARGDPQSLTPLALAPDAQVRALVVAVAPADGSAPAELRAYDLEGAPALGGGPILTLQAALAGPVVVVEDVFGNGGGTGLAVMGVDGSAHFVEIDPGGAHGVFVVDRVDSVDTAPVALRNGTRTVIAAASLGRNRIEAVASDGSVLSDGFALGNALAVRSSLVVGTVRDSTGILRQALAFGSSRGLSVLDASGAPVDARRFPVPFPEGYPSSSRGVLRAMPAEDPAEEDRFVLVDESGVVVLFEADVSGAWTSRFLGGRLDGPAVAEPAVADLDGDGRQDLVVLTAQRIWARYLSGAEMQGFPLRIEDQWVVDEARPDSLVGGPLVADVDADGANELLVFSAYGALHVFEADGQRAAGFPRLAGGAGSTSPAVFDYDRGGTRSRGLAFFEALGDSLGAGRRTRPARLTVLDLGPGRDPALGPGPAEWTAAGGSVQRGGRGSRGVAASGGGVLAELREDPAVVFPNPMRASDGMLSFVRFFSGRPHTCTLEVYDLEGESVRSIQREILAAGQPVEVEWSTRGLVPGPYVVRVLYQGASGPRNDLSTLYIER